jgi:hypothetical protein
MDTEEIEDQRRRGNERWNIVLIERMAVEQAKFVNGSRRFSCGNAFETDNRRCWSDSDPSLCPCSSIAPGVGWIRIGFEEENERATMPELAMRGAHHILRN